LELTISPSIQSPAQFLLARGGRAFSSTEADRVPRIGLRRGFGTFFNVFLGHFGRFSNEGGGGRLGIRRMDRFRERIGDIRSARPLLRCIFEAKAFPETASRLGAILSATDRKVRTLSVLIPSAFSVPIFRA
jgi:hypothetical protein